MDEGFEGLRCYGPASELCRCSVCCGTWSTKPKAWTLDPKPYKHLCRRAAVGPKLLPGCFAPMVLCLDTLITDLPLQIQERLPPSSVEPFRKAILFQFSCRPLGSADAWGTMPQTPLHHPCSTRLTRVCHPGLPPPPAPRPRCRVGRWDPTGVGSLEPAYPPDLRTPAAHCANIIVSATAVVDRRVSLVTRTELVLPLRQTARKLKKTNFTRESGIYPDPGNNIWSNRVVSLLTTWLRGLEHASN